MPVVMVSASEDNGRARKKVGKASAFSRGCGGGTGRRLMARGVPLRAYAGVALKLPAAGAGWRIGEGDRLQLLSYASPGGSTEAMMGMSVRRFHPTASGKSLMLCEFAFFGHMNSCSKSWVLPVARPISFDNSRNDIARIAASPPLLREFLTELAHSCDEIDMYARLHSQYSKAEKKQMEGRVVAGRDAQGKLSLCVLASKAGKLGDLSAPCAVTPGMFGACTEDAVLASSTDPTKKRYIEAKTLGEVARDSNGNSAHYHVNIRMRHDDGKRTQWETLMGFLRPAGANFRVFRTPEDTLSNIFDNMADSGYEVFIAHRPKMVQCAREGEKDLLYQDPRMIESNLPISATSGNGKGSKTWLNEAVAARFSFKKLRDEPDLLARLFVV